MLPMIEANDLSAGGDRLLSVSDCSRLFLTNQSIAAFQTISTQLAYVGYKKDITWARGDKKFLFETVLTQDTFSRRTCGPCSHCTPGELGLSLIIFNSGCRGCLRDWFSLVHGGLSHALNINKFVLYLQIFQKFCNLQPRYSYKHF